MSTTEPEFYDAAMTGEGEPAMLPLDESPWRELYYETGRMIWKECPVVDLGCGTGRFAAQLRNLGHGPYTGLDFSPATVDEARRYVPAASGEWNATFHVQDLRDWEPDDPRPGNVVYVCLETLEHLENDVDLVRRVPVGHEFIFSVPNYGGQAHLRCFPDVSDAWKRYGHLLRFQAWQLLGEGPRHYIHLYRTTRRGDSW